MAYIFDVNELQTHPNLSRVKWVFLNYLDTEETRTLFIQYIPKLVNVRHLVLKGLNLDDSFVKQLKFPHLEAIDLSDNPLITARTLHYLRDSNIIGSVRDHPSFCERTGYPYSHIYVNWTGTGITKAEYYAMTPRYDFKIRYTDSYYIQQSNPAMKELYWLAD